jgi:hypothetical protein
MLERVEDILTVNYLKWLHTAVAVITGHSKGY